ncbi:iron chaperone [Loigolactobacillus binensis]|uniref:Iron chaperone n=1 Tax=Loigolactobacillus binensis TaxID=2559922 RepID=A0ABW3E7D9_9LACO|nr:DUF1801 domain-containing protein [Loigolactobacillus binensis]
MTTAIFSAYLAKIPSQQQDRTATVLDWVSTTYPQLVPRIAWNQPMFTAHGTFIIGFSNAQKHLAIAPEAAAIEHFSAAIVAAGYTHTKQLIRLPWSHDVNYQLLQQIIDFNLATKEATTTFWRK